MASQLVESGPTRADYAAERYSRGLRIIARGLILSVDERSGRVLVASEGSGGVIYAVTERGCDCPDATDGYGAHQLGGWCKHRCARFALLRYGVDSVAAARLLGWETDMAGPVDLDSERPEWRGPTTPEQRDEEAAAEAEAAAAFAAADQAYWSARADEEAGTELAELAPIAGAADGPTVSRAAEARGGIGQLRDESESALWAGILALALPEGRIIFPAGMDTELVLDLLERIRLARARALDAILEVRMLVKEVTR